MDGHLQGVALSITCNTCSRIAHRFGLRLDIGGPHTARPILGR